MCKVICVTNRKAIRGDFIAQIERIASARPYALILREKDLSESEYLALADRVNAVCETYGVHFITHTYIKAEVGTLHLPIAAAAEYVGKIKVGASCHSLDDVIKAERIGCEYVTFGHVYPTACKNGLPPRGIDELRRICSATKLPVYAIGGIDEHNARSVIEAGASGVCIMSGAMKEDADITIKKLIQIKETI